MVYLWPAGLQFNGLLGILQVIQVLMNVYLWPAGLQFNGLLGILQSQVVLVQAKEGQGAIAVQQVVVWIQFHSMCVVQHCLCRTALLQCCIALLPQLFCLNTVWLGLCSQLLQPKHGTGAALFTVTSA